MDRVAGKAALQQEAAFLQRSGGRAVVNVAGRFDAKNSWRTQGVSSKRLYGLDHQALTPLAACEHIANVDDMAVETGVEHADELATRLQGDDVWERGASVPLSDAAGDEFACGLQEGMRPPDHVPSYICILGV